MNTSGALQASLIKTAICLLNNVSINHRSKQKHRYNLPIFSFEFNFRCQFMIKRKEGIFNGSARSRDPFHIHSKIKNEAVCDNCSKILTPAVRLEAN